MSIASKMLQDIELLCRNTTDGAHCCQKVGERMHRVELIKECLAGELVSLLLSVDPLLPPSYTKSFSIDLLRAQWWKYDLGNWPWLCFLDGPGMTRMLRNRSHTWTSNAR